MGAAGGLTTFPRNPSKRLDFEHGYLTQCNRGAPMKTPIRLYFLTLFAAAIWITAVFWLVGSFTLPTSFAILIFAAAGSGHLILSIYWLPCPPQGNAFIWLWLRFRTGFWAGVRRIFRRWFRRYGDILLVALFSIGIVMLVVARWIQPDPVYESFIGLAGLLMGFVVSVWVRALKSREVGLLVLCSFVIYVFPGSLAGFCKESGRHTYTLCGGIDGLQDWSSFYLGIGLALMSGTLPQLWPNRKHRRRLT